MMQILYIVHFRSSIREVKIEQGYNARKFISEVNASIVLQ